MNAFSRHSVRAFYTAQRSSARQRSTCGSYARYEARKQEWISRNPGATAEEYQRAMTAIAREVGV
jgi:hypothetical protein